MAEARTETRRVWSPEHLLFLHRSDLCVLACTCRKLCVVAAQRRHAFALPPTFERLEGAQTSGVGAMLCRSWLSSLQLARRELSAIRAARNSVPAAARPLAECESWERQQVYLETLESDLASSGVVEAHKVLRGLSGDRNGSTHTSDENKISDPGADDGGNCVVAADLVAALGAQLSWVRRQRADAVWGARYLRILRQPFEALRDKPLPALMPLLSPMLNTVGRLKMSSRQYSSDDTVAQLLAAVDGAVAARVTQPLHVGRMLSRLRGGGATGSGGDAAAPVTLPARAMARCLDDEMESLDRSLLLLRQWRTALFKGDGDARCDAARSQGGSDNATAAAAACATSVLGSSKHATPSPPALLPPSHREQVIHATSAAVDRCCELRELIGLMRHALRELLPPLERCCAIKSTGGGGGNDQAHRNDTRTELVLEAKRLRGDVQGIVRGVQKCLAVEGDINDINTSVADIFDARHTELWRAVHIQFRTRVGELMARVPAVAEALDIEYD